jgi:cobalt-zinc-cadmium efflux system outer membrane protein
LESPSGWDRAQWLQAAMRLNPRLAEARAEVAAVAAAQRTAAQRRNPTLNLFAEYVGVAGHGASWLYGMSMDFLLHRSGERSRMITQAALQTALAQSDLSESLWAVRSQLRQSLLDLMSARQEATLLQHLIDARTTLLASDRARAATGGLAASQLFGDELELSRAQQRQREAQSRELAARARLAAAVGVPVAALREADIDWNQWDDIAALPAPGSSEGRSAALIGRPQIVRALREYDLAEIGLQAAVAQRWPQLHLTPGYAYGSSGIREDAFNNTAQEGALGLDIELPLFNQHQGQIGEAVARRAVAGQHLIAVQAELYAQIDGAEQDWPRARAAWQEAVNQFAIAQRLREAEARQLQAGAADRASVASADIAATEAALLRLAAAREAQAAFGSLEDAYRRPLEGPELKLPGVPEARS